MTHPFLSSTGLKSEVAVGHQFSGNDPEAGYNQGRVVLGETLWETPAPLTSPPAAGPLIPEVPVQPCSTHYGPRPAHRFGLSTSRCTLCIYPGPCPALLCPGGNWVLQCIRSSQLPVLGSPGRRTLGWPHLQHALLVVQDLD